MATSRRKPTLAPTENPAAPPVEAAAPAAPAQSETATSEAQPTTTVETPEVMGTPQQVEGDGVEKTPIEAVADGVEREVALGPATAPAAPPAEKSEQTLAEVQAEIDRRVDEAMAEAEAAARPLPDVVDLGDGRVLRATSVGLPNTCSATGTPCTERWFATNRDAARSGLGICEEAVRELVQYLKDAKT